ncbi:MAG: hypothetical protein LKE51_02260 [Selenomonas sp.]|jgi:hypothetical protein|nr:hypothetical protein [Selenomonas sp.]
MEQAAEISRMRVHRPGGGHERRLFYDRLGRYLFIAAALSHDGHHLFNHFLCRTAGEC